MDADMIPFDSMEELFKDDFNKEMSSHCLMCDSLMVTRMNHRNFHKFRGCSNFPKCTYTEEYFEEGEIIDNREEETMDINDVVNHFRGRELETAYYKGGDIVLEFKGNLVLILSSCESDVMFEIKRKVIKFEDLTKEERGLF